MKLYADKEAFASLVSSAAQYMELPEVYIEKDYWVTQALKNLSESVVNQKTVFKGGTSLSKAHHLIQRFSEDIDLAVIGSNMGDSKRKKLLKSIEEITSEGLEFVPDDIRNSKGSKFRKTVYRYPMNIGETHFGQASSELLIEVNTFTTPEPCERKPIQSMIAEFLNDQKRQDLIEQYNLQPFALNVLSVERTLVEKLLGIIKDSNFADPIARLSSRIRHLYDVCMILRHKKYRLFAQSGAFKQMCEECISDEIASWGNEQSTWLKKPLERAPIFEELTHWWPALKRTYKSDFADLVYGELPGADEIIQTFKFLKKQV